MDDLIADVAETFGIDQARTREALAIMLGLIKSDGDPDLVGQLMDRLPGASALLAEAQPPRSGGLFAALGGAVGGNAMKAYGQLQALDLDTTQMKGIAEALFAYAENKAGKELVGDVVRSVPALNAMVQSRRDGT